MRLCGGVAAVGSGGVAGITVLTDRGDSNCSGDIALEPGKVDSIFFPGRVAGCRRLIAISCSASLMTSGSSGCRDSNIASGRSYRRKELLSVLRRRGRRAHGESGVVMNTTAPPAAGIASGVLGYQAKSYTVFVSGISYTVWKCANTSVVFPIINHFFQRLITLRFFKGRATCSNIYKACCKNSNECKRDISFIVAVRSVAVCLMIHVFLS